MSDHESRLAIVRDIANRHGNDPGRLMDIGRSIHAELGYISETAIGELAALLGVRRVQVRDTISFYAFLDRKPRGQLVIHVCDAVVERMKGAGDVIAAFESALGVALGETTEDGKFSLRATPCIGLSDQGPSALINEIPLVGLTPDAVPNIVAALRSGADPASLPQAAVADNLLKPGPVIFSEMAPGAGISAAMAKTPDEVIAEMTAAGLRGRGGAGFPAGMKWKFCRAAKGDAHYVVCNADEGEPGTFKDRVILKQQPDLLFEGMTVAAYAIGAEEGFFYLRAEYAYMLDALEAVLAKRREAGLLGANILGKESFNFDIRIQLGAGAYICGEESALIESMEGHRGAPRTRPPFPVQQGYKNQPTAVNNVETLCAAARIAEKGAAWFADMGTKDSAGTKLLSVSGDCAKPGVYEVEYGLTLDEMLDMVGAVDTQAVQVGGPSGTCIGPNEFERKIAFEDLSTGGSMIVFGPDRDLLQCMAEFTDFFIEESCGWCAPCRVGTTLLAKKLDKVLSGKGTFGDLDELKQLGETVKTMSRCGLGQTAANPILSTLKNFPEHYEALVNDAAFIPPFDLAKAMEACCDITGRTPHVQEDKT